MQSTAHVMRKMRPGFFARSFSTSKSINNVWKPGPSPPRLPKEEQEMFEKLQQQSTGAFSTPRSLTSATDPAPPTGNAGSETIRSQSEADKMLDMLKEKARLEASGDGEELHPNVRRGAAPEFKGETNPKTGEVGGPKNEPLRWGHESDWSYNGRVTDF
ncbi:hypothetical protein AMS68_003352 [Peltaster fructicola]|uniref:Succinate dehydrogenase assembly factor 4, mitochondrial n=1 Tax=Peltaster fructicola TaxID=286661 RepID=A0A6H0XT60_9PEZI|nr:hypothetical protein AMS68_003352 [Peltaster fructicola]